MRFIHESHHFFFFKSHLKKSQSCRKKGHLVDFNGKVLTNVNFKNLTEQLGFRGRQQHHEGAFLDVLHHNFYYNNKTGDPIAVQCSCL